MAQIAFWGPNVHQNGSTAVLASVASLMSVEYDYSTLMIGTGFMDNSLESAFFNVGKMKSRSAIDFTDVGIDALERLIKSGKLTLENLVDYTTPILKGRLDLMFGTQKKDPETYEKVLNMLPNILKVAQTTYDMIFVDVKNGPPDAHMMDILQNSDLIVINVSQSMNVLEEFFNEIAKSDILKEKKYLLVIGRYDRYSKFNAKNLAKYFKHKDKIFTLPYNSQFFDMQNDHKTLNFFLKYRNVKSIDRNGFFVNEIKCLAEEIRNNIVISTEK